MFLFYYYFNQILAYITHILVFSPQLYRHKENSEVWSPSKSQNISVCPLLFTIFLSAALGNSSDVQPILRINNVLSFVSNSTTATNWNNKCPKNFSKAFKQNYWSKLWHYWHHVSAGVEEKGHCNFTWISSE